ALRGLALHADGSAEMVDHLVVLELRSLDDGRREFRIGADIAVAHALRCLLRVWIRENQTVEPELPYDGRNLHLSFLLSLRPAASRARRCVPRPSVSVAR